MKEKSNKPSGIHARIGVQWYYGFAKDCPSKPISRELHEFLDGLARNGKSLEGQGPKSGELEAITEPIIRSRNSDRHTTVQSDPNRQDASYVLRPLHPDA